MDDRSTNNGTTTGNSNNNGGDNTPNNRPTWVTTHFVWGEIQPGMQRGNGTAAHLHIAVDLDAAAMPGFSQQKPRASERAIRRLKQVDFTSLQKDATCSICFDTYDDPSKLDQQDPPESVPGEHVHTGHDDDPPESVPEHMASESADPAESVPEGRNDGAAAPADDLPEQPDDHRPLEMPCGHIFGARCLKEWLHESSTCPMCRTAIETQDDYLRESGQGTPGADLGSLLRPFFTAFLGATNRRPQPATATTSTTPPQPSESTQGNNQSNSGGSGDDDPSESVPTDQLPSERNQETPPLQGYYGGGVGYQPFGPRFVIFNGRPFHTFWAQQDGRPATQQQEAQNNEAAQSQPNANTSQSRPQTPNNREQTFVSNTAINNAVSALQEQANRIRQQVNQPIGSNSSTSTEFSRPVPTSTQRPYRETARSNREARHHPYGQRSSPASSETTLVSDSDALSELASQPSVQCASLPMALCVCSSEAPDMVRLGCGHGYHEPCLRMAMRAHGDTDIPNLSTTPQSGQDGSVREAWCHVCRRYRPIVH